MAALNLISSQKVPGRTGPPGTEVYQLWVENPAGLRKATYGDRIPQQVLPHDHASRRAAPIDAPLLQSSLGPQATPGAAVGAWLPGIPLYPPTGFSFATTPKLVWSERLEILGGVKEGYLEVVFEYSGGSGTVELRAQLRPLEDHGLEGGEGSGPTSTLSHALTGATRPTRNSFHFANLEDLGPSSINRTVLAELWLSDDPDANNWRLCAVAWVNGTNATENPAGEPNEWLPPRVTLDVSSVQTGKIVQTEIGQSAHQIWNQIGREVLGGTPGVKGNGQAMTAAPYRRIIWRRHRHTGRSFTDPETGELTSDGALIPLPFAEVCGSYDLDDSATNILTADPVKGILLHPNDTLDAANGWLNVEHRIEAPIGCPEFLMQARISFANIFQVGRLWWYIKLQTIGGNLLDFDWVAGGANVDPDRAGTFAKILVEPMDAVPWIQNSIRLGAGLGLWTQKCARQPLPEGVRTTDNLPRLTKVMRLKYTPTQTGPIKMVHGWALEQGAEGSLNYDNLARFCGLRVWPAPGY